MSLCVTILAGIWVGCSPMDEYLDKYTDGKDIQYPGVVFPAYMHSGKNRVVLEGYLISDPKISKIRIYWNSRNDSIEQNIQRSEGIDLLNISIPLPEGGYNFEVFTYDNEGNTSIPVILSATSYGDSYQETLYDRLVKNLTKEGDNVSIEWYSSDPTSPFVEINYPLSDGGSRTIRVPFDSLRTVLPDYKAKSGFSMRTYYLPDETAIDTFYTDKSWKAVNEDVTQDYILNAGLPFLRGDEGTGKWGTPKDWTITPNVLNQDKNTKGGWSTNGNPQGVIHLESRDYSGDGITNGKVHQTLALPAGKYIFEAECSNSATTGSSFLNVALAVAKGNALPDLEQMETDALGYYLRKTASGKETYALEFELTEDATITLGCVASFGRNSYVQFSQVRLLFVPQQLSEM